MVTSCREKFLLVWVVIYHWSICCTGRTTWSRREGNEGKERLDVLSVRNGRRRRRGRIWRSSEAWGSRLLLRGTRWPWGASWEATPRRIKFRSRPLMFPPWSQQKVSMRRTRKTCLQHHDLDLDRFEFKSRDHYLGNGDTWWWVWMKRVIVAVERRKRGWTLFWTLAERVQSSLDAPMLRLYRFLIPGTASFILTLCFAVTRYIDG